jgi:hypothetical protein
VHWAVEYIISGDDQWLVVNVLAAFDVTLETHEQKTYLRSPELDALANANDVRASAVEIVEAVKSAVLRQPVKFDIGTALLRVADDGSFVKHAYTQIVASAGGFASVQLGVVTIEAKGSTLLSDEEPRVAQERQKQAERDSRSAKAITRAIAARKSKYVTLARRLLAEVPFSERAMYGVRDCIRQDSRNNLAALGLKSEMSRFSRSINHEESFGDKSRHVVSIEPPHPNPMTRSEAETFIRAAAERWFELVASRQ